MASKLVILESPSKTGTVSGILGSEYTVLASKGHIRDLPETMLGVKIEDDFEPVYVNLRRQTQIINQLKKSAMEASCIYLASDPDREGEAIAWHLSYILKNVTCPVYRVTFNEITRKGVLEGMNNPREIDLNLVDSYQARRVLDRLVGYQISPVLWKKVKKNLSAGRVQSVATRLIVDREEEVNAFVPQEYWTICSMFSKDGTKNESFKAEYFNRGGGSKKETVSDEATCNEIIAAIGDGIFNVSDVKKSERKQSPMPPFNTSALQQDAAHRLGFAPSKTMRIAQQLYEGVNVPGIGNTGLITYIRTDSLRVSDDAYNAAKAYIKEKYGEAFVPAKRRIFKNKNNSQDAHEAIRPSHFEVLPERVSQVLTSDQYKLYKLIFERFIASQMSDASFYQTVITLKHDDIVFRATGSTVKFKGFLSVYDYKPASKTDGEAENEKLPALKAGDVLKSFGLQKKQHFTQPPARYNEASLVKALEELGIGRPSTYATIVSTIESREYVKNEKRVLYPTEIGKIVTDIMKKGFPEIVDVKFTANVEDRLDRVASGDVKWKEVIRDFYGPFSKELKAAEDNIEKVRILPKESDEVCPNCGRTLVYRKSRYGEFLGCPGYPHCKYIKPIADEVGKNCPQCGKPLVYKKSSKGRKFISCSGYPDCKFTSLYVPTGELCPQCGSHMIYKTGKNRRKYIICSNNSCKYLPSAAQKDSDGES
ncbi:MAG: type I DNA topoisomerase [Clostridia bacterium]|nr:type I DNA topoisomerase [Clostridia bacterium]